MPEEPKKLMERRGYYSQQIFNYDEMSLFWKKIADHTCIHKSAKQAFEFKDLESSPYSGAMWQCSRPHDQARPCLQG